MIRSTRLLMAASAILFVSGMTGSADVFYRATGHEFTAPKATTPPVADTLVATVSGVTNPVSYGSPWTLVFDATGGTANDLVTTYDGTSDLDPRIRIEQNGTSVSIISTGLPDGTYGPFSITAADGKSPPVSKSFSVVVSQASSALAVVNSAPTGIRIAQNADVAMVFSASGGKAPYTFAATNMPAGLTSQQSGSALTVSGKVTAPGTYAGITMVATDAMQRSSTTTTGQIVQDAPLTMATPSAASLSVQSGATWAVEMATTGGRPDAAGAYAFTVNPALPTSSGTTTTLVATSTGSTFRITGIAPSGTYGGTDGYVVTATDSLGKKISSEPFKVVVAPAPSSYAAWGGGDNGKLGNGLEGNPTTPVATLVGLSFDVIAPASLYTCGQTGAKIYCWGSGAPGYGGTGITVGKTVPTTPIPGDYDAGTLGSGYDFSCALRSGKPWCWGTGNGWGQYGNGTTTPSSTPVAATTSLTFAKLRVGYNNTCGITSTKAAYCWGYNAAGMLGLGTTDNLSQPSSTAIAGLWDDLYIGSAHICGSRNGGTFCWGNDANGGLGNGTGGSSTTPQTTSIGSFDMMAGGQNYYCGIRSRKMFCWGYGGSGALGSGNYTNLQSPTQIAGDWDKVFLGPAAQTTCGLNGTKLTCWGSNSGAFGTGGTADSKSPGTATVSGDYSHLVIGGGLSAMIATKSQ